MSVQEAQTLFSVLLVEDDSIDQMAFRRLIKEENLPYDYQIVPSISAASKLLESRSFDIVIMDYALGDGTAFDLLPHVKNTPVVIVTGTGDEEVAVKAMKAGAYDYLIKDPDRHYLKVLPSTVEKAVEHYRRENEVNLLSHAVMSAIDSIFITDLEGTVIFVNAAFEETYGYSPEEVIGRPCFFLWEDEKPAKESIFGGAASPWKGEFNHRRKDGNTFPVSLSKSFMKDEAGKESAVVCVVRDITEARQAQEDLARSNADLEQFATIASHDLQEPLRLLAAGLQLLIKRYDGKLDDKDHEFISHAVEGVGRLQRLVSDLLAYSRIGSHSVEFSEVDTNLLFERALFNLKMSIGEGKAEITHDSLPVARGDEIQLVQLFQNLIGNGIKFGKEEPVRIHVWAERRGNEWVFGVRDNGIGIDMKHAENIFKIFHRIEPGGKTPGTGVGLAICKRIVERHRGRIWVESAPGQGATFFFTIPA